MGSFGTIGVFPVLALSEVRRVIQELENQNPEAWQIVYPRAYQEVGEYYSPRLLAADLLSAFLVRSHAERNKMRLGLPDQHALVSASVLAKLRVPTFFVSRSLLEALVQTRPPQAIDWRSLHLPFEAAAFIFPRGSLVDPQKDEMGFVWYARTRKNTIYADPLQPGFTYTVEEDKLFFRGAGSTTLTSFMHGFTESVHATISMVDLSGRESTDLGQSNQALNQGEASLLEAAISLTLGILLVMLARPELIQAGAFTGKRSKAGTEFWTPNIIGGKYRAQGAEVRGTGTASSPRLHWRRGHWRDQPFGQGRLLHKNLWIEPTLVGAHDSAT